MVQYCSKASYHCHIASHITGMIKIYLAGDMSFQNQKNYCSPEVWYWSTVWLSLQGVIGVSGAWPMHILSGSLVDLVLCFSSWLAPPLLPLSPFPLLVSVMGECREPGIGAHSWVLGSMPTIGVLSGPGAYWVACFRSKSYDILGTQPPFPKRIYSYLFKLSNEWLR